MWSDTIQIGSAKVRVSFSPEPTGKRVQIDTVVKAIGKAEHSVIFCIFTPTDKDLRAACFKGGDKGLMMFGLVNNISPDSAAKAEAARKDGKVLTNPQLANMELFHRSRDQKDVIEGAYFSPATVPEGFEPELRTFPGAEVPEYAPVVIHHKFVVVDAEGSYPVVYTGSANMSENSEHNNDENLLEIRDGRVAAIYLAEFMRLYEHYRARAHAIKQKKQPARAKKKPLALRPNREWADRHYTPGSPEWKARLAMAASPS